MKIATICYPVTSDSIFLAREKNTKERKSPTLGLYNGWGGKAEDGESIFRAAVREFGEESTASVDEADLELVAVIDFFEGAKHLFECHIFFAHKWDGELRETKEMWAGEKFSKNQLPLDQMWVGDVKWLPMICLGRKIKARLHYKQGMKEVESFTWTPLV